MVKADAAQLEQVLMNLAVNSRDAMPDGGSLTIETAGVELDHTYAKKKSGVTPGAYAMIGVSDTGCGMDKATLDRIFEPFFTTKERDKGTGLGLATSYGIIKQHGGNIWAYSEPNKGSVFKIYLPLHAERDAYPSRPVQCVPPLTGSPTVLVVEDDPLVRKLTGQILTGQGYTIIESDDVADAIAKAKAYNGSIHLVLTDVVMPGMKGPEAFDKIRVYHPEARVLYMSGYTDNMTAIQNILKEGVQYIQKPFTIKGLLEKCHLALHDE
jgi:CheY-like chemotaxis protein